MLDDATGWVRWDGGSFALSEVRSVWYRRPTEPTSFGLSSEEDNWLLQERGHFLRALWRSIDALWVSPPAAIRDASLKLVQLRRARELGFQVPPYVATNNAGVARNFCQAQPGGVVVKVLGSPALLGKDRLGTLYTHLLRPGDLDHIEAVRYGPTFFQRFIRKHRDIRVTVIGEHVFAVAIDASDHDGDAAVDFRRANIFDLPHDPIALPAPLARACTELVRSFGLSFGAIDLVEDMTGDPWFLEINPNGQWLWLEWMTGLPMTDALCELLIGESRIPVALERGTIPVGRQQLDGDHRDSQFRVFLEHRREGLRMHLATRQTGPDGPP